MLSTTEQILQAARRCFFQHGYTAANISMISRYAGISRVTIHKQFGNKETLLRALLCHVHCEQYDKFESYLNSSSCIWEQMEAMFMDWGQPLFDEIADQMVMADLIKSCSDLCSDLFDAHTEKVKLFIVSILKRAEQDAQLSFEQCSFSLEQFAETLVLSTKGIISSTHVAHAKQVMLNNLAIYRRALERPC